MKLIDVIREGSCITLITDEGELKNSWSRNQGIEQKARLLIGKNIKHETWGGYDSTKWFSNIIEVVDAENLDLPSAPDAGASNTGVSNIVGLDEESLPNSNFTYGVIYESQTSQRLIGPPGTGKTTELIRLVKGQIAAGVESKDIAFITFTNVAADEAIARIQQAFKGQDHDFSNFSTLHSLATRCGGSLGKNLVGPEEFQIFDRSISLVEEWIKVGDATSAVFRPKHPILDAESYRINTESDVLDFSKTTSKKSVEAALERFFGKKLADYSELKAKIVSYLASYQQFKENNNLADFNDVVVNVTSGEFSQDEIPCFKFLIVDEAQDLSRLQWRFVRRLAQNAEKIIIAGDDDQAIMEDFGASPSDFVNFATTEQDVHLQQSYRLSIKMKKWLDAEVLPDLLRHTPNRLKKFWDGRLSSEDQGDIVFSEFVEKEVQGEMRTIGRTINLNRLLRIIQSRQNDEWLIMAPTRATCEKISNGLNSLQVPHFYLRRDVIDNSNKIYVQTIHSSKGMDVENAALVVDSRGDNFMLENDVRLRYVALTRAKSELYPSVIGNDLVHEWIVK